MDDFVCWVVIVGDGYDVVEGVRVGSVNVFEDVDERICCRVVWEDDNVSCVGWWWW